MSVLITSTCFLSPTEAVIWGPSMEPPEMNPHNDYERDGQQMQELITQRIQELLLDCL